ncbi:MAG: glycosyltransferase [Planctomycetota bacterium]|nr:glycosyltransferase [Planctomycetota bacterium]
MIFVTIGTQLPFDRLIRAVDEWAGAKPGREVVAQTGRGKYEPRHIRCLETVEPTEFQRLVRESQFIVAHAGMGTILSALEIGKPVVLLPRLAAHGEHRNDHQLATAERFGVRPLVRVARDETALAGILDELERGTTVSEEGSGRISDSASPELIAKLREFFASARPRRGGSP